MTVVTVLRRTRALIAKRWARYAYARDLGGHEVPLHSKRAAGFCLAGGVIRAARGNPGLIRRSLAVLGGVMGGLPPAVNNAPGMTKACLLADIDRAIKAAGK